MEGTWSVPNLPHDNAKYVIKVAVGNGCELLGQVRSGC